MDRQRCPSGDRFSPHLGLEIWKSIGLMDRKGEGDSLQERVSLPGAGGSIGTEAVESDSPFLFG